MVSVSGILENILSHQYDPVKAHEYYLRTRELVGRTPGAPDGIAPPKGTKTTSKPSPVTVNPNQAEKDRMHYVIDGKLTAIELAMAPATKGAAGKKPKMLTEADKAKLSAVSEAAKKVLAEIANDLYNKRLKFGRDQYAKLEAVPKVPKGLGVLETQRRQEKRMEAIKKIKGEYKQNVLEATNEASTLTSNAKAKFSLEKQKIQDTAKKNLEAALTQSVDSANVEYERLKKDLATLLGVRKVGV